MLHVELNSCAVIQESLTLVSCVATNHTPSNLMHVPMPLFLVVQKYLPPRPPLPFVMGGKGSLFFTFPEWQTMGREHDVPPGSDCCVLFSHLQ